MADDDTQTPQLNAAEIVEYVRLLKNRAADRDIRHRDITNIRDGNYDAVAPGIFPPEFPRAMVANLIDIAARDVSELMAPLPSFHCSSVSMTNDAAKKRAETRGRIANGYVQTSRLAQQRYPGADRYVTFGFKAYIVEPSFQMKSPVIRVGCVASSYYTLDHFGRCRMFAEVYKSPTDVLAQTFPQHRDQIMRAAGSDSVYGEAQRKELEVICFYSDSHYAMILSEGPLVLTEAENPIGRCPVVVVERPSITSQVHGQFDDVIWLQIVRAMVQNYTLQALEDSINAPIVVPTGTNQMELGSRTVMETDNPQGVGRLQLALPQGLFPEQQILGQEQLTGSRYPQGRTGNIDASVITGQGVQALMGTFDTQIQTFQRLDAIALEDAVSMAFQMDEEVWGDTAKTVTIKEAGAPVKFTYTPSKDIAGDYTVDVSYGAIAGLDPNRGLVFVLQALQAQLISRDTAMRSLPIDINAGAEQQKIDVEMMREALGGMFATLPQVALQELAQGADPRQMILAIVDGIERRQKNDTLEDVAKRIFAPRQTSEETAEPAAPAAAQQAAPQTPGQAILSSLAGLTANGGANLNTTVRQTA